MPRGDPRQGWILAARLCFCRAGEARAARGARRGSGGGGCDGWGVLGALITGLGLPSPALHGPAQCSRAQDVCPSSSPCHVLQGEQERAVLPLLPVLGGPIPKVTGSLLGAALDVHIPYPQQLGLQCVQSAGPQLLFLPSFLPPALLEAPHLMSQHCPGLSGGTGPAARAWGCANGSRMGRGKPCWGALPAEGSVCRGCLC